MIEKHSKPLPWQVILIVMATGLSACVSTPPPVSTPPGPPDTGRYDMLHDSPELEPIDLSQVEEVIPVVERRTMAGNFSPYTVNGQTYRVMSSEEGYEENGIASWYGRKFHGHLTSNGEIYDMFQLSAAHKSLPIPSFVEVTNLENGRSVIVRVNDRGPFHPERVIDLSYAGAVMLGFAEQGTARVSVRAIVPETAPEQDQSPRTYAATARSQVNSVATQEEIAAQRQRIEADLGQEFLQVGAFSSQLGAQNLLASLAGLTSLPGVIHSEAGDGGSQLHRVRLGPLSEGMEVQPVIQRIIDAGFGTPFRVRY